MLPDLEPRYNVKTVAERYGVTSRTVHRWIDEGKLRAIQPGRLRFITPNALVEFEAQWTIGGKLKPEVANDDDDDADLPPASGE